jgi:hypothetical protein
LRSRRSSITRPFANAVSGAAQQPPKLPGDKQPDVHVGRRAICEINAEIPRRDRGRQHQHNIPRAFILRLGIQYPSICQRHAETRDISQPRLHYGTSAKRGGNPRHAVHRHFRTQIGGDPGLVLGGMVLARHGAMKPLWSYSHRLPNLLSKPKPEIAKQREGIRRCCDLL